jgi:SAM-dependent methyltransferase
MPTYSRAQVAGFFDELGLGEWERLVKTPVAEVKLHIHAHYLRAHAPPGGRVLEIGAGPGRFTQMLAALGCRIVVADISPVQLSFNRQKAGELGFAAAVEEWRLMDICDMRQVPDASFDAVVAYGGPLSYVFEERERALSECIRVTRAGGTLMLGVMSLWGSAHAFLPDLVAQPPELNRAIIQSGDTLEGRHRCHMYRAAELRSLLDRPGLDLLAISASNCLSTRGEETLAGIRQDAVRWHELLQMELEACREPGCLDMGTHLIAVVRKR